VDSERFNTYPFQRVGGRTQRRNGRAARRVLDARARVCLPLPLPPRGFIKAWVHTYEWVGSVWRMASGSAGVLLCRVCARRV